MQVRAAGGVVWRRTAAGGVEVVLVRRARHADWSLPKGKAEAGESWREAAIREVTEETGMTVVVGAYVGSQRYRDAGLDGMAELHQPRDKEVRFWAMEARGGTFEPTTEIAQIAWLGIGQARARCTHERDRAVLDAFVNAPR